MLPCFGIFNAQTADAAKWAASAQRLSVTKRVIVMDDIVIIALAPFYGIAVCATCYVGIYMSHAAKKLDQSATETQMTETTSPGSTQQK